jgi:hypothetical protein
VAASAARAVVDAVPAVVVAVAAPGIAASISS